MNKNDKKPRANPNKGHVDPKTIREYTVHSETTLMEFLMHVMPDSPRKTIKSILTHHQVSVGGVPVSQYDFPLSKEDVVIVSKNPIRRKQTRELPLLYEDESIIAINKPSGLLSIASDREKGRTAYRLVSEYVASKSPKARIYVVHRLDEDTSGVLIFAKDAKTKEALQESWQEIVEKRGYYAIVEGEMEEKERTLQDYLAQNNLQLMYVTKNKSAGKLCITHYKVIAYKAPYSLLDVNISSGRKNQIRVQLGHRGHHVIGDDKYGEPADPLGRLGLHAYSLILTNPLTNKRYELEAPMPPEFKSMFFGAKKKAAEAPAKKSPKAYRPTRSATKIEKGKKKRERFSNAKRKP